MRKFRKFLWTGFSVLAIFGAEVLLPQSVSTKVTIDSDIFLTDAGLLPLPENAIGLERVFTIRSEHFQSLLKLAIAPDENLYVSSWKNNIVSVFDPAGKFRNLFGGEKAAKGGLRGPLDLAAAKDFLIVHEMDRTNPRHRRYNLHFIDYQGKSLRRREIPLVHDIVSDGSDCLYLAPYVEDQDSPLVRIDSADGKSRSFGKPLIFRHSLTALNTRSLSVNEKGEIFIAFTHLPIVRKYGPEGALRGEFRVESSVFRAKENYNLKLIGEGMADAEARGGYKELISEIQAFAGRVYLLSYYPRLEITELDEDGLRLATYWMDSREVYAADDFAVADIGGERRFFVSHPSPPKYEIDIFRSKERKLSEGLPGEIEKLSAEIEADPEHAMAYHNRGVARHQAGDFPGAIEDLTKAIELAPDSALAYHNRGLARVKAGKFDGAILDFSKVIELKPSASAYFDRGIARAHSRDYEKAIGDFERAAESDPAFKSKALEQIDFCRKRLKAKK
jgi:hypothetical protein